MSRWKGAASDVFLLEAVRLMEGKGYSLGNIDITVIAERPKLSPHKQKILDNLYKLLKSPADTINLKVEMTHPIVATLELTLRTWCALQSELVFCFGLRASLQTKISRRARRWCVTVVC